MPQLRATTGILADLAACNVKTCWDKAMLQPPGRAPSPQVTSAEQRQVAKEPSGGSATGMGQSGAAGSRAGYNQMQGHSHPREQRVASELTTDSHSYIWSIQKSSRSSVPEAGRLPES